MMDTLYLTVYFFINIESRMINQILLDLKLRWLYIDTNVFNFPLDIFHEWEKNKTIQNTQHVPQTEIHIQTDRFFQSKN